MKFSKILSLTAASVMLVTSAASCSDSKTYAELLTDETHYVNAYLADQRVIDEIPADSVFEYGENAPYYRIDEDGGMYMQVINPGTPGNDVKSNELIYFRFTRYNMQSYIDGKFEQAEGNDDVLGGNLAFRYGNYELSSSYSYGSGIQKPLEFLPVDCQVNIIIKSQYGMPSEMSNVIPWLYSLRYYRPKF